MASLAQDVTSILQRHGVQPLSHADQRVSDAWLMLLDQLPDQPSRIADEPGSQKSHSSTAEQSN